MPTKTETPLYIPGEQVQTIYFTKPGGKDPDTGEEREIVMLWMDVKADLTFDERRRLFWDESDLPDKLDEHGEPVIGKDGKPEKLPKSQEEIWELLAPFVLDWSVGERIKGKEVKVDPPAVAGGKQFGLIAEQYVIELMRDLRFRSTGAVKSDFLPR